MLVGDTVGNVLTKEHPDLGSPIERDGEKPERNQGILPSTWWMGPMMMGWSWAPQSSPRPKSRRRVKPCMKVPDCGIRDMGTNHNLGYSGALSMLQPWDEFPGGEESVLRNGRVGYYQPMPAIALLW